VNGAAKGLQQKYTCFWLWVLLLFMVVREMNKTFKLVMGLWVTMFVVFSAMPGVVICVGSHGHIAVEAEHDNHCDGEQGAHEDAQHEDDSCGGDCFDISFSYDGGPQIASALKRGSSETRMVLSLVPVVIQNDLLLTGSVQVRKGPAEVTVLSLFAQQTVVMRT
jgi:hypothetical protein